MLGKLVAVWHGIVWYLREISARPATTIILSISRPSIPAKHR